MRQEMRLARIRLKDNIQPPTAMPDFLPRFFFARLSAPKPRRPAGIGVLLFLLAFIVTFLSADNLVSAAERNSWELVIEEHHATPERLVAVDKSRQQLSLFERRSPLKLTRLFTCTTGRAVGDKVLEGDLKTPEGIYFVVQRIGSGLKFLKYGNEAYTLNYPNPVDRLRRKTGYGIWIHGRGEPLAPLQTQGCVSMNNEDLASIAPLLVPGTPVALTESFSHSPASDSQRAATVRILEKKVQDWAKAWGQRSASMFDFYDKQAYSIAQSEPFSRFQAQKERLFKHLPWINTSVRDIRVLQGPGYWVTWFYQDYRAPNLSTRGVRRLYWAPDAKGDFKILGMEWAPGMTMGTLLASVEPALPPIESQPRTEGQSPPSMAGGSGVTEPAPAQAASPKAPEQAPAPVSPPKTPEPARAAPSVPPSDPVVVADASPADPATGSTPPEPEKRAFADHVEDPSQGKMAEPPYAARMMAELKARAHASAAPGTASPPVALDLPPALPSQGLATSKRASAPEQPPSAKAPEPALLASGPPPSHVPEFGPTVPVQKLPEQEPNVPNEKEAAQNAPEREIPAGTKSGSPVPDKPSQEPHGDKNGAERQSDPEPEKTGARESSPSAEDIGSNIASITEDWRAAWESGNIDAYCAFYAPKARQGSRHSASALRAQKSKLWERAAPASVKLEDVRIVVGKSVVTAEMRQEYADSKGGGDKGIKILIFENINGRWLITQEKWRSFPNEANN